jgi:very-short-patch-repair endonuclease
VNVYCELSVSLERRRALRRLMSPCEHLLWSRLRRRQVANLKFRRRHPLGPYTVAFYCPEAKLAVELDDPEQPRPDERSRERFLESYGISLLRFTNEEFMNDIDTALGRIASLARTLRNTRW